MLARSILLAAATVAFPAIATAQSTEPAQPAEPAQAAEPAQPAQPARPAKPAQPAPRTAPAVDDDAALDAALAAAEQRAAESEPEVAAPLPTTGRHGFTIEIGVGVAGLSMFPDSGNSTVEAARSLDLAAGAFVSPSLALSLRLASATYSAHDVDGVAYALTSAFTGPALQYWFGERTFLGVGVGLGTSFDDNDKHEGKNGFAANLRLGYDAFTSAHHAFHVAAELTPAIYDKASIINFGVSASWQML
jgi:hypothetical protein